MPYAGQSRVIPWADYANGGWWEMTPFVDHDQPTKNAVYAARMWAGRHGYRVQVMLPPPHQRRFAPWRFRFVDREEATGAEANTR